MGIASDITTVLVALIAAGGTIVSAVLIHRQAVTQKHTDTIKISVDGHLTMLTEQLNQLQAYVLTQNTTLLEQAEAARTAARVAAEAVAAVAAHLSARRPPEDPE